MPKRWQTIRVKRWYSLIWKKDISPIINAEASEGVDNMDSDGEDTFSLAPRSQEGNFLSHDEICSPVSNWLTEFVNTLISPLIEESKGVPWPYLPVLGPCQKGGKLYASEDGIV
jgi:hypothetical protein